MAASAQARDPQAGFGAGGAEDVLRDLFGGGSSFGGFGGGGGRGPRRGADARAELTVDFETAALGGERTIQFADGRSLTVRLPAGIEDGGTLRLRGQGQPGPPGGRPATCC